MIDFHGTNMHLQQPNKSPADQRKIADRRCLPCPLYFVGVVSPAADFTSRYRKTAHNGQSIADTYQPDALERIAWHGSEHPSFW
jgi:hypothetical protein